MARIFIGLSVSETLAAKVLHLQQELSDLPVRWISKENLHLTLLPPWQGEIEETKEHFLQFVPSSDEISYQLNKITTIHNMLWLEGVAAPALIKLKTDLEHHFQMLSTRLFRPHVTIARAKNLPGKIFPSFSFAEKAPALVLYQSHLNPAGARYEKLAELSLVN